MELHNEHEEYLISHIEQFQQAYLLGIIHKEEIQIKDNFLNQKELEILNNNINKIQYAPTLNESGNFGFRHNFNESLENKWLFEKIKKQFFPNENLKVDNSSYHLRHNHKKVLVHKDDNDYNFLLYLKGRELIYNGT